MRNIIDDQNEPENEWWSYKSGKTFWQKRDASIHRILWEREMVRIFQETATVITYIVSRYIIHNFLLQI